MMKKGNYLTLTIVISLSYCLLTQDCFATQWAKTYGGLNDDYAYSIQQTTDGGYIVAGYTGSFDVASADFWVLKLDQIGKISWQKTVGGGSVDEASSVRQTTDGGYIVAGNTGSAGSGYRDCSILKLFQDGTVSWQKSYGGGAFDYAYSIQQTTDGGYIVAGKTNSFGAGDYDMLIFKLDSAGTVSWQKMFGGIGVDIAYSIQQTTDGGYIAAGYTTSYGVGNHDYWILKLDPAGTVSWQKTFGGSNDDLANYIQQTRDGGYIVAGITRSFGASLHDWWILKLDSDGTVAWQKMFGGTGSDRFYSIQQTTDGGYIAAGRTTAFGAGDSDMWILKLDSDGTVAWQKTFGGSNADLAYSIHQTTDGGFSVAGVTYSFGVGNADMWILKLDSNGDINNCDSIETSAAIVTDTAISGLTSNAIVSSTSINIEDTAFSPQNSSAERATQCFAPDWFPAEPPSQDRLNGVWGYISSQSIHEFYAVGEEGTIIHFDGTDWTGTGSPTSNDLYGVWGSSETDIFAVGENGIIVRYVDQSGWETMDPPTDFTNTLYDIWGSSESDVYAVGEAGAIIHYDGVDWTEITSPASETLTGIWGSSSTDFVAVGEGGTILTYNGTSWNDIDPSPTTEDLSEVWGSGPDNTYAVGKGGTIIHYDGNDWNTIASPTSANLRGIWGSTANNIFAVGEHGTILYYDGVSWIKMDSGVQDSLVSTFGTLNPRVMVVGYDGNILSLGGPSVQGKICNACTGEGIDEVTVEFDKSLLGGEGVEYREEQTDADGIYPTIPSQGGPYPLLLTATDYLTKEIIVDLPFNSSIVDHATYLLPDPGYQDCLSGTISRTVQIGTIPKDNDRGVQNIDVKLYKGSSEEASTTTDVGGNYHFTGLSGGDYRVEPVINASECTTTPEDYTGIMVPTTDQYNFDLNCPETPPTTQGYWQEMESGTENLLHAIWGSASNNIYVVGDEGEIIHYGTSWTPQTSGITENLKGVWGSSGTDVYAVGAAGTVIKTTDGGTTWSPMTSNTPNGLNAIWGHSDTDIFAVGDKGTIIHGDGTNWTLMNSGTEVKLLGIWGNSSTDVYAVGNSHKEEYWKRTVLHYNGSIWEEVDTGNGVTLMSPWGSAIDDITAAGSFGSIMRYKEWEVGQGAEWKQIGGPTEKTLNAMWGSSGSNIFAVGYKGVIAHYDGTEWTTRETDTPNDLYGIWGIVDTSVYAVGDNGKIYSYSGDLDGDGEPDITDNCLTTANGPNLGTCTSGETIGESCVSNGECGIDGFCSMDQENSDSDFLGDVCDNCPDDDNEDQANSDYDTLGNACDNCPFNSNLNQEDIDADDVGDECDNCPNDYNPGQENTDTDSLPDACDNCPNDYNPDQTNSDGADDGGDVCDPCPSIYPNECNPEGSGAWIIGTDGTPPEGISPPDGSSTIFIPAGAVNEDFTVSATDTEQEGLTLETDLGDSKALQAVELEASVESFETPVTVRLEWTDEDPDDGFVDGFDNPQIDEADILMIRNGVIVTTGCSITNECTCIDYCCVECCRCNLTENYFEIDVTSFSDYALAVPLDSDGDTVPDNFDGEEDNCPYAVNPNQEDEGDSDGVGDLCDNCPDTPNAEQTDTYPPGGNNCGDACDCEGNFDGDFDVDGGDAALFKADFGRSGFKNPCNNDPVCNGNFDCDLDVDGGDAATFKADFGRSPFKNPCPSCSTSPWCVY